MVNTVDWFQHLFPPPGVLSLHKMQKGSGCNIVWLIRRTSVNFGRWKSGGGCAFAAFAFSLSRHGCLCLSLLAWHGSEINALIDCNHRPHFTYCVRVEAYQWENGLNHLAIAIR